MFSTTGHLSCSTDHQAATINSRARRISDVDAEVAELRMLTRAGEMHPRDAAALIADLEQQTARRDTLGAAGSGATFDLEIWHGDPRDLQASGLL